MDKVVEKLNEISNTLLFIANKMESIDNKLDDVKGYGSYNSLSDICDKIDSLENTISSNSF